MLSVIDEHGKLYGYRSGDRAAPGARNFAVTSYQYTGNSDHHTHDRPKYDIWRCIKDWARRSM